MKLILTSLFRTGKNIMCHVNFNIDVANLLFQGLTLSFYNQCQILCCFLD